MMIRCNTCLHRYLYIYIAYIYIYIVCIYIYIYIKLNTLLCLLLESVWLKHLCGILFPGNESGCGAPGEDLPTNAGNYVI